MRSHRSRLLLCGISALAAGVVLLLAGCFETALNLGSAADSKLDTKLVGDWTFAFKDNGEDKTGNLLVRNFDGRQYYAEWTDGGRKPQRMRGHLVPIKSATFVELTNLTDTGEVPDKHLIMRVEVADNSLTLRQLNEKFFDGVSTDRQLRAKVESNLDNAEMYAETTTGTRTGP